MRTHLSGRMINRSLPRGHTEAGWFVLLHSILSLILIVPGVPQRIYGSTFCCRPRKQNQSTSIGLQLGAGVHHRLTDGEFRVSCFVWHKWSRLLRNMYFCFCLPMCCALVL